MRERWLLILIEGAPDQEGMEVMNPPSIHVQGHPTDMQLMTALKRKQNTREGQGEKNRSSITVGDKSGSEKQIKTQTIQML